MGQLFLFNNLLIYNTNDFYIEKIDELAGKLGILHDDIFYGDKSVLSS